jgi:endonuclease G
VLLQGAISSFAFAEQVPGASRPGGLRDVLDAARISGPLAATFTDEDFPLTWAYPLGSRLANQTGELEAAAASRFSALGAVGMQPEGASEFIRVGGMKPAGEGYGFSAGKRYSVRGSAISGHSEILNRDVAWLIWNVIQTEADVSGAEDAAATEAASSATGEASRISAKVLQATREANEKMRRAFDEVFSAPEAASAPTAPTPEPIGPPTLALSSEQPNPGEQMPAGVGRNVEIEDQAVIERVVGEAEFLPAYFLEQGAERQRAIGRVTLTRETEGLPPGTGWGTGFMISPTLLMTNNHVIPSRAFARRVELQMNFQIDFNGRPRPVEIYAFDSAGEATFVTDEALDFTVLRIKPRTEPAALGEPPREVRAGDRWGFIRLDLDAVLYSAGRQQVNIVQHPRGRPKEVVVHGNLLTKVFEQVVHYQADTEPASSGSPVLNNSWELIGLHHAGGERGASGAWISNEAIRVDKIIEHLRQHAPAEVIQELGI